jgi:hypothetical protein
MSGMRPITEEDNQPRGKREMKYLIGIGNLGLCALTLLTAALAGCGGGKTTLVVPDPSAPVGLPTPPAAGSVNTYTGTQSPGAWTLTLDHTKGVFSYQPTTYPAAGTTGSIQSTNGFLTLGSTGGYALEVQGRAAILRPGNATAPIVVAVPQTECYPITGRIVLPYIGMWPGTASNGFGGAGPTVGYGSITASTDTTGAAWQFGDMEGNVVAGPTSFTGTCSTANGEAAVNFTGQKSVLNDIVVAAPTSTTQSSIWVGPSGFFVADQSDPAASSPTGGSVAGVVEPTSALTTTDLASQTYLGFLYEPATTGGHSGSMPAPTYTSPIGFGQVVASSGTTMTGGVYPNDDVTQTPNSDTIINLGTQDATYNGLYPSVSITVLDPAQNCANYTGPTGSDTPTPGINAEGYATCTFSGVAVAGNPEGKYALFISSYNWAAQLGGVPMQIYLFQQ